MICKAFKQKKPCKLPQLADNMTMCDNHQSWWSYSHIRLALSQPYGRFTFRQRLAQAHRPLLLLLSHERRRGDGDPQEVRGQGRGPDQGQPRVRVDHGGTAVVAVASAFQRFDKGWSQRLWLLYCRDFLTDFENWRLVWKISVSVKVDLSACAFIVEIFWQIW